MKLIDVLNEMPYLHPGEMPRKILDGSYSIAAIQRTFRVLGKIGNINILMCNDYTRIIGIPDTSIPDSDSRIMPVFVLIFKSSNVLKFQHTFKSILQIDIVAITKSHGDRGVMSSVCEQLPT